MLYNIDNEYITITREYVVSKDNISQGSIVARPGTLNEELSGDRRDPEQRHHQRGNEGSVQQCQHRSPGLVDPV